VCDLAAAEAQRSARKQAASKCTVRRRGIALRILWGKHGVCTFLALGDIKPVTGATQKNASLMAFTKILVAEDSDTDFFLLERAFGKSDMNARLFRVRDGVEAKAHLTALDREAYPIPDLILADLKMPRCNGLELLGWLRSQPVLKRIPCLIFSASRAQSDINRAYELFTNSYLVKPSRYEDLVLVLQQLKDYWLKLIEKPELPH